MLSIGNNLDLYYQRFEGAPDKPHLVFLHEGLGCTAMWKQFPSMLCNETGCPGLAYDRQGYGKSSPLSSNRTIHYLHDYALKELPVVIERLLPDKQFILVGHSDGGTISLIYGSERPGGLVGIITEAAHVFVDTDTLTGIETTVHANMRGELTGLQKYHGSKTPQIFSAWHETWQSPWFRHWNIEYLLPSIQCPVLVIQGNDDKYGTLEQVNSIASKTGGPAEKAMIENCGHSPHIEQPQIVLNVMRRFIERILSE